jgi:hypothetical protein
MLTRSRNLGVFAFSSALFTFGCASLPDEGSPGRPAAATEPTTVVILPEAPHVLPLVLRSAELAVVVDHLKRRHSPSRIQVSLDLQGGHLGRSRAWSAHVDQDHGRERLTKRTEGMEVLAALPQVRSAGSIEGSMQ